MVRRGRLEAFEARAVRHVAVVGGLGAAAVAVGLWVGAEVSEGFVPRPPPADAADAAFLRSLGFAWVLVLGPAMVAVVAGVASLVLRAAPPSLERAGALVAVALVGGGVGLLLVPMVVGGLANEVKPEAAGVLACALPPAGSVVGLVLCLTVGAGRPPAARPTCRGAGNGDEDRGWWGD